MRDSLTGFLIQAVLQLESSVLQYQHELMSAIFMDTLTSYSTIVPTYMTKWRQTTYVVSLETQNAQSNHQE